MPLYLLSNCSYIKDNIFKFGYSKKKYDELLLQYTKNKRTIVNPFIIKWWNIESCIKIEKEIHRNLKKDSNIENISSEWYKCKSLSYIIKKIDDEILLKHKKYTNNKILDEFKRYSIFKYMIKKEIKLSIENYINNLDKSYLHNLIKITSLDIFNFNFFIKKIFTYVYTKDFENKKIKHNLCNILKNYNSPFFINYINIESYNIEVEFDEYKKQFSKKEYIEYVQKGNKNILKTNNIINYYAEVIFLTNENLKEKLYNIKKLNKTEILYIIEDSDFYKNIDIYFKNNTINIKKYTLYQLFYMKQLNNHVNEESSRF